MHLLQWGEHCKLYSGLAGGPACATLNNQKVFAKYSLSLQRILFHFAYSDFTKFKEGGGERAGWGGLGGGEKEVHDNSPSIQKAEAEGLPSFHDFQARVGNTVGSKPCTTTTWNLFPNKQAEFLKIKGMLVFLGRSPGFLSVCYFSYFQSFNKQEEKEMKNHPILLSVMYLQPGARSV